MKLNEYIEQLCDAFNQLIGCENCPHNKNCSGSLGDELNEVADFELDKY